MAAGSRTNLIRAAAAVLARRYSAGRALAAERYQALRDAGAFRAPEGLAPGLQAQLGLPEPLRPDAGLTEAA
jgi:hypothetical protein